MSDIVFSFPEIDPVAIALGPVEIRWYALSYLAGLIGGWYFIRRYTAQSPFAITRAELDDLLVWVTLGTVIGGRLGYVLFYNLPVYLQDPLQILMVWQGGMAFHGGMLGVVLSFFLFAGRRGLNPLAVGDAVSCAAPIGLFFGRMANFINAELYGRETDGPFGMIFPTDPLGLIRHPSQIYQALMEGLILFLALFALSRVSAIRHRAGVLSGVFLIGYGIARMIGEVFRQPDAHLGFIAGGVTMGQILSVPMIAVGAAVVWLCRRRPAMAARI